MYIRGSASNLASNATEIDSSVQSDWSTVWLILSSIGLSYFIFVWIALIAAVRSSFTHLYKKIKLPLACYPPLSILKPLSGGGNRLQQNLQTFFQLNYPKFELIFCVHARSDPAYTIVTNLLKQYPHVDATLIVSEESEVYTKYPNPKIENLLPGYQSAKYGLIVISDCSIKADKDSMLDFVNEYNAEEGVGLVWQLPVVLCQLRKTLGVAVNQVYFAIITCKLFLLTAHVFRVPGASGSSMLIRKEALDQCGGIGAFGKYLAEDYFISTEIHRRGWKVRLGSRLALHNPPAIPDLTMRNLFLRTLRWKRLRQTMIPWVELINPFAETWGLGLIGAFSLKYLLSVNFAITFLIHMVLSFLSDIVLLKRVLHGRKTVSLMQITLGWIMVQLGSIVMHTIGPFSCQVAWRGSKYRLKCGGEVESVNSQVEITQPVNV